MAQYGIAAQRAVATVAAVVPPSCLLAAGGMMPCCGRENERPCAGSILAACPVVAKRSMTDKRGCKPPVMHRWGARLPSRSQPSVIRPASSAGSRSGLDESLLVSAASLLARLQTAMFTPCRNGCGSREKEGGQTQNLRQELLAERIPCSRSRQELKSPWS